MARNTPKGCAKNTSALAHLSRERGGLVGGIPGQRGRHAAGVQPPQSPIDTEKPGPACRIQVGHSRRLGPSVSEGLQPEACAGLKFQAALSQHLSHILALILVPQFQGHGVSAVLHGYQCGGGYNVPFFGYDLLDGFSHEL